LALCAVLIFSLSAFAADTGAKKNIVMIAGHPSHGPGEHEHNAGTQLLAKCLREGLGDKVDVKVHLNGEWPTAAELDQADTIVIYADGGGAHPAVQGDHLAELAREMKRGCGLVCLHYAVEPAYEKANWPEGKEIPADRGSKGKGAAEFKDWLGGYFEQYWSVNPTWKADFKELPKHPITRGVKPFTTNDEWYYHMRFRDGMKGVTPILTAMPPESTATQNVGTHSGNPQVRHEVVDEKKPQTVAWCVQRDDGGRGFGFSGGHFHKNWANENQRTLVLNAIYWTAHGDVPADGVESKVSEDEIKANLDKKK
jgi:type 1 glutamine amidotransferase